MMKTENIFNRRPVLSLLIIMLIITVLVVFLVEVTLRFTPYQVYVTKGQGAFPPMFVVDDQAGFDLAENYKGGSHSTIETEYPVFSNNVSCFDEDVELNKRHNILIGDSFTWGFSPLDKKWTTVLEKNTNHNFIKCGVPAYGPKQTLFKLKKLIKKIGKAPKTLIYAYYWNDLNDDYTGRASTAIEGHLINRIKSFNYKTGDIEYSTKEDLVKTFQQYKEHGDSDYQSLSASKKIRYWIRKNSIIANLVFNAVFANKPQEVEMIVEGNSAQYKTYLSKMNIDKYPWVDKAWKNHLKNIGNLINYARSIDSKIMVVIIPTKDHVYPNNMTKEALENIKKSHLRLKNYLAEKKVSYFDLFDGFSKASNHSNNLYLSNDLHFTTEGEALAGKLISEYLIKSKYLDLPRTENN